MKRKTGKKSRAVMQIIKDVDIKNDTPKVAITAEDGRVWVFGYNELTRMKNQVWGLFEQTNDPLYSDLHTLICGLKNFKVEVR